MGHALEWYSLEESFLFNNIGAFDWEFVSIDALGY
jgi:hypothetical protein